MILLQIIFNVLLYCSHIINADALRGQSSENKDGVQGSSNECVQDQSVFCGVMYLKDYCWTDDFYKLCCKTCKKYISLRHDQYGEEPHQR